MAQCETFLLDDIKDDSKITSVKSYPTISEDQEICDIFNELYVNFVLNFNIPEFSDKGRVQNPSIIQSKRYWEVVLRSFRGSRWSIFFNIGVLKMFSNFTGKHLCWSLFLIKYFVKNRFQRRCFPVKFEKFLRIPLFYRTPPVAVSRSL